MDPSLRNRKIVDLTEEELTAFMGDNVSSGVKRIVDKVRAHPDKLGSKSSYLPCFTVYFSLPHPLPFSGVTCSMVECLKQEASQSAQCDEITPDTRPLGDAKTPLSFHTIVPPNLISEYEMHFYYHGISGNPPRLLWRSNLESDPFPTPPAGARFFSIPRKTAHGVFNTPLNKLWDNTVVPQIKASMKKRGIKYSAIKTARFSIVKDRDEESFGPIVIWIAVRPKTTNAAAVRDATPDILDILTASQITGVVVEWYEGSVVRLAGQPLMRAERRTNAKFGLNHPFNIGLGIPIARQSDDTQGTLTFLFKEVKTISGEPSDRILALTTKHVASLDTTTDFVLNDAEPQHILACSDRRLSRAIAEIQKAVTNGLRDAAELVEESEDTPDDDVSYLSRARNTLDNKNEGNTSLQTLLDEVKANWTDSNGRRFGVVDWAPHISARVDDRHYTRDIATFAVDKEKLGNFEKNNVDLGNQYTARQLEDLFWPFADVREGRRIPTNLQLPIRAALTCRRALNPDTENRNGDPLFIVAKYGNTTKLTLGHYSGMDAYICTDLGEESREVAVYNYSKTSGNFSDYGDSGSLIFTGDGDALAILHSGMHRGSYNHVTYGTPIWWVIQQILTRYPFATFCGMTYITE